MNSRSKSLFSIAILILLALLLGGCYRNAEITESEIGLAMSNGITIDPDGVKFTGRYTDGGWYANIVEIDTSAKTTIWSDPDMITRDKEIIGFEVGVTYRRTRDPKEILKLWNTYPSEAQSDEALKTQVDNRMARSMKQVTAMYSLDEMFGTAGTDVDRSDLTQSAFDKVSSELAEVGIELLDIGVNNINPSDSYRASLDAKAKAASAVEVSRNETIALQEKLKQEQAQTQIALEHAKRDNEVAMIEATLLTQSPEAFELEKIKAMADIFGEKSVIYFMQPGTDISAFFNSPSNTVPVTVAEQK